MRYNTFAVLGLLIIYCCSFYVLHIPPGPRILVFTKTAGYHHSSIDTAAAAIKKLGAENGFDVEATSNTNNFTENGLKRYAAVVFLSTTGNILNATQEADFERYIQAGGGYVGIHAAADGGYDWRWYGHLVGGYFNGHPAQQEAVLSVMDNTHPSTRHLPAKWKRLDEWYNFKMLDSSIHVLINIDESSYAGGTNGDHHPMSWWHHFDGGRAFYTALGHTEASYADPLFLKHLLGGIQYAIGHNKPLDYSKATTQRVPDEAFFHKTVLTQGQFTEPTEMAILPSLDVLVAQRRGELLYYHANTKQLTPAGKLNVYWMSKDTTVNAEEGLLGITADPAFSKNHFIYLYYAAADTPMNRLSRFTVIHEHIDRASEKVILQLYSQRDICCHTGGSLTFDKNGLLYLSTGDNTTPFNEAGETYTTQGFAPIDDRPGHEQYDDRRSSANTNDLRGKILRLKINANGSYSIPTGNLFAPGTPKARPEIYVMGTRNPYRISVDQQNGNLYWGEVGPDAPNNDAGRGPMGYDEINQAKSAGNFGYPFFIGPNYAYNAFDYSTGISGTPFDPLHPVNNSRNSTGLTDLPAAQPALIWYPYGASEEFPQVGSGGRTAMAGPVYYSHAYANKKAALPAYYNGKLFIYDWMRGWIKVVTLDKKGDFYHMEPFLGKTKFNAPVDMELGPDGKLYVLEYGKGWYSKNEDAALSCIEFDSAFKQLPITNTSSIKLHVDGASLVTGHQSKWDARGLALIQQSDCMTCHKTSEKSIGPAFTNVAAKYSNTSANVDKLASKIISGGSGVWGEIPMPAHPTLTSADARVIVDYIFSFRGSK